MTSGTNPGDDDGTGEPSRWDSFVRAMSGEDLVGQILGGRYELQERIGSGGMGVVYLARHRTLTDRRFAVKVLHRALADDPECRVRFLREAKAAASIEDPHVVWVTDFGPASEAEEGPLYLVMEHLEGEDLSRTLAREGAMSWERAAAVVTQICQALHAAHARHVIHRDIKPQNCFRVTRRETSDFIKVLDFGMARIEGPRDDSRWTIGGTRGYIAPEVLVGAPADHRVDVFGVGALLCRLLTNRQPHSLLAWLHAAVAPSAQSRIVSLPRHALHIIRRATHPDPELRYGSVEELAQAVVAVVPGARGRVAAPIRPVYEDTPAPAPEPTPPAPARPTTPGGRVRLHAAPDVRGEIDVLAHLDDARRRGLIPAAPFDELGPGALDPSRRLRIQLHGPTPAVIAYPYLHDGRTGSQRSTVTLAALARSGFLFCPRGVALPPRFALTAADAPPRITLRETSDPQATAVELILAPSRPETSVSPSPDSAPFDDECETWKSPPRAGGAARRGGVIEET